MTKLTNAQKKERLLRELTRIESEEKKSKQIKNQKILKTASEEILKYEISGIDHITKIIGLLKFFEYKNDKFRDGIIKYGEEELEARKKQKIKRLKVEREPYND
ncbi:TPA: hypothetical protein ACXPX8_005667 [Klebsiella variicola subsp. variicola]